jgi:hypothetical protein
MAVRPAVVSDGRQPVQKAKVGGIGPGGLTTPRANDTPGGDKSDAPAHGVCLRPSGLECQIAGD